jgi:predicted NAD/FAD-dependent oxidoreductase
MSGQNIRANKWTRRKFISTSLQAGGAISLLGLSGCSTKNEHEIPCRFAGANANFGHLLKNLELTQPTYTLETPLLIIGGGVSGLTTGYELWNRGIQDFLLIDNADIPGGNSMGGSNAYSSYPLGAHYLTLPNLDNTDLIQFLEKNKIITGYAHDGKPIYNELDMCFAPQERLFIKNKWQEGLIPHYGITKEDDRQIKKFLQFTEELKNKKNAQGKFIYNIPMALGDLDEEALSWDKLSFKQWLTQNGFNSEPLLWYLNYGTRDDYGTHIDDISALVGLHYFAARRGEAANGSSNTVLTWPEGNYHLVKLLAAPIRKNIRNRMMALQVKITDDKIHVICAEDGKPGCFEIICNQSVLATPQYINRRLLVNIDEYKQRTQEQVEYAPWLVANISLENFENSQPHQQICWDNVIYGSDSLGYVYAQHQQLTPVNGPHVITWYYPLVQLAGKEAREFLRTTNEAYWLKKIQEDLETAHPGISKKILNVELWQWGHAMIQPLPGVVSKLRNNNLHAPIRNQLFFCHSDLSGISLFEEAFYHGLRAAHEVFKSIQG